MFIIKIIIFFTCPRFVHAPGCLSTQDIDYVCIEH